MHPLRGLLQPRSIVDRAADHECLIASGVLDSAHRSGLSLLPQLPELLGDALRNSLGRSVLACIGNEYCHLCSLLSLEIHPHASCVQTNKLNAFSPLRMLLALE